MLHIGISGACGKMGKRIAALAIKDKSVAVAAAIERNGADSVGEDIGLISSGKEIGVGITIDLAKACSAIDCLIDFTLPEPTVEHLKICRAKKVPMVIGTTGMNPEQEAAIKTASKTIPIVYSPNMAIGVNVVFNIAAEVARILGRDFKIKIDETHHIHKKDSPSGTAKMIAKVIKASSGIEAPIEAFRKGEVIGNHGIVFDGEYETIEIRHDAKSRDVFAAGAIKAAKFAANKDAGLYTMADVLGLK